MTEVPKISDKTDLSLAEAKSEYKKLSALANQTDGFPNHGTGWSQTMLNKINARMDYLRERIADYICMGNEDEPTIERPKRKETGNGKELKTAVARIIQIIQINTIPASGRGKKYFCRTEQEKRRFSENNPGVRTESFNIEMPASIANKRINTPENRKQFEEK